MKLKDKDNQFEYLMYVHVPENPSTDQVLTTNMMGSYFIAKRFREIWPNLVYSVVGATSILLADDNYILPKKDDIKKILKESLIDMYKYTVHSFDCDDYSLLAHAFIVQERYKIKKNKLEKKQPWAFGQAWGSKFNGKEVSHAVNICYTQDEGIIFIEPQTDKIWRANSEQDKVIFIRM